MITMDLYLDKQEVKEAILYYLSKEKGLTLSPEFDIQMSSVSIIIKTIPFIDETKTKLKSEPAVSI